MNTYINGETKDYFSSFNKSSFNSIINYNILKNKKEIDNLKLGKLSKKLDTNERIKKLMEFYSKNLDDENKINIFQKVDGITFKTYNNNVELSEKDKKLFII